MRTRSNGIRLMATVTTLLAMAVGLFASVPVVAQEWSAPRTVWIQDTGHTLDRLFLDEWRENGELLGLPITEEAERPTLIDGLPADTRVVQYFENVAIAYVPEAQESSLLVRALPLGADTLREDIESFDNLHMIDRATCAAGSETCLEFEKTGHTVSGAFLDFWDEYDGERLIGAPLTEPFAANDGSTTQYFENAVLQQRGHSPVEPRPIGNEQAKRLKIATRAMEQPVSVPVYAPELFVSPEIFAVGGAAPVAPMLGAGVSAITLGPGPQQGGYKEIVVSVAAQMLWAYEDGMVIAQTLVSTGTGEVVETETPPGFYTVLVKFDKQTMQGTINKEDYKVEDVPWVMYFDNLGNALHGTYWHNNFGTPMSHGCVNLPLDFAEFLYAWAPEGTQVTVIA